MLVRFLEDRQVSPDGVLVVRVAAGSELDVPDPLAARLIQQGAAAPVESKALGGAPENKQRPAVRRRRGGVG